MNFEEQFQTKNVVYSNDEDNVRWGWDACKNEILHLINQKYNGANTTFYLEDIEQLIDEINKL